MRVAKQLSFIIDNGETNEELIAQVEKQIEGCHSAMNDDFNTALTIGQLFNLLKKINSLNSGGLMFGELGEELFNKLKQTFIDFIENVLGLEEEQPADFDELVDSMLEIYKQAKFRKDFEKVDEMRTALKKNGVIVKDMKEKIEWAYEE